jgi:hypothetical protein
LVDYWSGLSEEKLVKNDDDGPELRSARLPSTTTSTLTSAGTTYFWDEYILILAE